MPSAPKWVFDTLNLFVSQIPEVQVSQTEYLSTTVKRISLQGDFEKLQFSVGAFFDIRVSDTNARRYTIAEINSEKNSLQLIAHIHGNGCGSDFMNHLEVGDRLVLNKPRTEQKYYDKAAEKIVFFGDETSLALACSFCLLWRSKRRNICSFLNWMQRTMLSRKYSAWKIALCFQNQPCFLIQIRLKSYPFSKMNIGPTLTLCLQGM
ncbi:FAD-binding oxidoreductase [Sphingobacterium sp. E70]|uniref:FAD-binding oxidoreductase n=1 Tax=Sphingobacterium sp. E70 TaxID=2853439 RepID=UPI00211CF44E|nr:FAD-binding oxidoreductase [Sphingobacterium sp. E70]ULT25230.1 FAD-binding oxidoreductase [Sphingobacterium sp. E70]